MDVHLDAMVRNTPPELLYSARYYLSHCYSIASMGEIIRSPLSSLSVCLFVCLSVFLSVCPRSRGRNFSPILMKFGTDIWNLIRKNPFVGGQNPIRVSSIFTPFPLNWHLLVHNAFSMRVLKYFSGVVCGPIIAAQSSNDVTWRQPPQNVKRG